MHAYIRKTWFSARNVRVTFADRSRYGNDGPTRASWKKWMVARMNEYGDVNAQVNAEKCTENDSKRQDAFARFTFFHWREIVRKTDVDDDVATTVNFSHRRRVGGQRCLKIMGARNTYFRHEKKREKHRDETRVS